MTDNEFYEQAQEGMEISIDVQERFIEVGGKRFGFQLSDIEYELIANKGIAATFRKYGKDLWKKMTEPDQSVHELEGHPESTDKRLEW